eukprot:TRINITY_DN68001_c1_g1_i1.p1 TRINITY_DN68001_c1_g1~~TRINITY_DN68001_c1_g1_i1.p1  ORF type:complete len:157 (+),score=17.21 TRINITY_DN68001_c1_g1_i1:59-529(+)
MDSISEEMLETLLKADCNTGTEFPATFDHAETKMWETFESLKKDLSSQFPNVSVSLDENVQDASFATDLTITTADNVNMSCRFSNFGQLFTTWQYKGRDTSPTLTEEQRAMFDVMIKAAQDSGFKFVDPKGLNTPYTGKNPDLQGTNWWIRYFDYL